MIIVELSSGVTTLPEADARALYLRLCEGSHPAYLLETGPGADRESFFSAARRVLPLDPPLVSSRSWEALNDSLWEGLYSLSEPQVVIVWMDAYKMRSAAPDDYESAISVLNDVATSFREPLRSGGRSLDVAVYVASTK